MSSDLEKYVNKKVNGRTGSVPHYKYDFRLVEKCFQKRLRKMALLRTNYLFLIIHTFRNLMFFKRVGSDCGFYLYAVKCEK